MFSPLSRPEVKEIVKIQLNGIAKMLMQNDIKLTATEEAIEWLSQLGYDPQFGARPLKRVLQREVLNELSKQILGGKVKRDSEIILDTFGQGFIFRNPVNMDKVVNV